MASAFVEVSGCPWALSSLFLQVFVLPRLRNWFLFIFVCWEVIVVKDNYCIVTWLHLTNYRSVLRHLCLSFLPFLALVLSCVNRFFNYGSACATVHWLHHIKGWWVAVCHGFDCALQGRDLFALLQYFIEDAIEYVHYSSVRAAILLLFISFITFLFRRIALSISVLHEATLASLGSLWLCKVCWICIILSYFNHHVTLYFILNYYN